MVCWISEPLIFRTEDAGDREPCILYAHGGGFVNGALEASDSIAADESGDGSAMPVGGGRVSEETDESPVADPGPDA